MATTTLHLDFETFSELDLTKVGGDRYQRDPSTETLMAAYSICHEPRGDQPVEQWVPVEGQMMPRDLREALRDPAVVKLAWNSPFEKSHLEHVVGEEVRPEEWRDPMILAMCRSFPGKLEKVGDILGIAEEDKKMAARGKALMRIFSFPTKPTKANGMRTRTHWFTPGFGDRWDEYKAYNVNDVKAERAIWRKLLPFNIPNHEWRNWLLDWRINQLGIPINREMVDRAVALVDAAQARRIAEMKRLTGLANPNSNPQLLGWLQEHGYVYDDLKAGHVKTAYAQEKAAVERPGSNTDDLVMKVLELRLEVSKTSVTKYAALQRALPDDNRIRGAFQFAGAQRTWRYAGRIFQPQNLARPTPEFETPAQQVLGAKHIREIDPDAIELVYSKPIDLLSSCIRTAVQADPGYVFIDADLNAIENRVLGWMADDQKILDVYKNKRCPYVDFATYMFGGTFEELWYEYKELKNKKKRTTSKPAVLGCGYMLSAGQEFENEKTGEMEATGLLGYAWNMGVKLTHEEAVTSVQVWRDTFEDAVDYWRVIEHAAKRTIRTGEPTEAGPVEFRMRGPFMEMWLPSGRPLSYFQPRIENKMMPWGKKKPAITYMGLNDKKQWVRLDTHPGKLTENADQAISRDLLDHGKKLAWKEGIRTVVHVHDQLVAQVPEREAEEKLRILIECMETRPSWARSLPLGSEGHISPVMVKD